MKTSNLGSPICDVLSCLVMSNSLGPRGLQPIRLLCPWRFSRQEYGSGLPYTSLGNLPNPGIEPTPLMSSALTSRFFTTSTTWEKLTDCISKMALTLALHYLVEIPAISITVLYFWICSHVLYCTVYVLPMVGNLFNLNDDNLFILVS